MYINKSNSAAFITPTLVIKPGEGRDFNAVEAELNAGTINTYLEAGVLVFEANKPEVKKEIKPEIKKEEVKAEVKQPEVKK